MENATEALKMAFAVLVFVMAMSLAFMMVTQARSTADVVFQANDKQEYVENITSIGQNATDNYRIVGLDTVMPTIYRYAQENYGVTIIDKDNADNYKIAGLYDLQVENTISSISSTWAVGKANYNKMLQLWQGDPTNGTDTVVGIKTYIKDATGIDISLDYGNGSQSTQIQEIFAGTSTINGIYKITSPKSTSCPWTSSTFNIMKRIEADMKGETKEFGESGKLKYDGKKFGASKNQGFMNAYGSATFKEYYYTVKTENPLTEEEETSKLQIIYVKEP